MKNTFQHKHHSIIQVTGTVISLLHRKYIFHVDEAHTGSVHLVMDLRNTVLYVSQHN